MTITRFVLYCFFVLLLCLLGTGFYAHQNLHSLVERQAEIYLLDYGVQDIDLAHLRITDNHVATEKLAIHGELDGLKFQASLTSLDLRYHWRKLLRGELQSVNIEQLDLVVERIATGANKPPAPVNIEDLLPQPLIAALPLQSLGIKQWTLQYQAPGARPISAMGSLLLENQLSLQLATRYLGSPVTAKIWTIDNDLPVSVQVLLNNGKADVSAITAQLQRKATDQWEWSVEGSVHYAPALAWLRGLARETELPLNVAALDGMALSGSTRVSARLKHPNTISTTPQTGVSILSQFTADISTGNRVTRLDYPGTVDALTGEVDISLKLDAGQWHLTAGPTELTGQLWTQQLSLPEDARDWLRWKETVPARWRNLEPIRIRSAANGAWTLQLRNILALTGTRDSEIRWEALNLDASIQPGPQVELDARLDARIKSRLRKQQLPEFKLTSDHQGSLQDSTFSVTLDDTAESMSLSLQGKLNIDTGRGQYSLSASSQDLPYAASTVLPIMQSFGMLQENVELSTGTLSLESELASDTFAIDSWRQQSTLSIENLSGSFADYRFGGITLSADWTGIEQWQTPHPVEFSMATLDVGFDVINVRARVALPAPTPPAQPVVRIEQFSAGMFGGRVFLPAARSWDFAAETNQLTLRAEQWLLADMVALQQGQNIQAVGVLEGELPVTVAAGRIIIENGYLRALPPGGNIRYVADDAARALAASSPELGLAMDLLSDFQYEVLSSEVELDKDGNLLLGLSLGGKNPAQYEGRPINFNINLEQNLDPLLQSLRLSDKLVEGIEGRLQ